MNSSHLGRVGYLYPGLFYGCLTERSSDSTLMLGLVGYRCAGVPDFVRLFVYFEYGSNP